jgi:hypothetical protein
VDIKEVEALNLLHYSPIDEALWRRCDGALLVTLPVIYVKFKAHLTSRAIIILQ